MSRPRYDRPALYALTSGKAASCPTMASLSSGLMMWSQVTSGLAVAGLKACAPPGNAVSARLDPPEPGNGRRRAHRRRRERAGRLDHASCVDIFDADVHRHTVHVIERQRVAVEAGGVEARQRRPPRQPRARPRDRRGRPRRATARSHDPRAPRPEPSWRATPRSSRGRATAESGARRPSPLSRSRLGLRRRVARVVHPDLSRLARPIRVNDRKDLPGAASRRLVVVRPSASKKSSVTK